jgi:putative ABC transport system substrate-binding protein
MIPFGSALLRVLVDRVEMPPEWLFFPMNWRRSGLSFCASLFRIRRPSPFSSIRISRLSGRFRADVEAAARALGLATSFLQASTASEIEGAFNSLAQTRPDALLVGPGPFLDSQRDLLVARAAKIAIPAAYETRATAMAGGLVSYGADVGDAYRQVGIYVGRVLKGEKPADLPVAQATKLELVINLKTAKALGLDLPAKILALADEVVE